MSNINLLYNNTIDNIASETAYSAESITQLLEVSTNLFNKVREIHRSIGISVSVNGGQQYIAKDDLIAIEATSNYSFLYIINGQKILTSKTLKHWQEKIDNRDMVRIHSKYLINKNHIKSVQRKQGIIALSNEMEVMCSRRSRKTSLFDVLS